MLNKILVQMAKNHGENQLSLLMTTEKVKASCYVSEPAKITEVSEFIRHSSLLRCLGGSVG